MRDAPDSSSVQVIPPGSGEVASPSATDRVLPHEDPGDNLGMTFTLASLVLLFDLPCFSLLPSFPCFL